MQLNYHASLTSEFSPSRLWTRKLKSRNYESTNLELSVVIQELKVRNPKSSRTHEISFSIQSLKLTPIGVLEKSTESCYKLCHARPSELELAPASTCSGLLHMLLLVRVSYLHLRSLSKQFWSESLVAVAELLSVLKPPRTGRQVIRSKDQAGD
ncbi:hypothetical protein QL285_022039 [Trifolium repens]|nr:hypothetical protein QL285_022039 [Trifolium repens]